MKISFRVYLALFFGFGVALVSRADTTRPAADPAYVQAVVDFVEAANKEMAALHANLDTFLKKSNVAETDKTTKERVAAIRQQLTECDDLLQQMTKVNQKYFDGVKSAYERGRESARKAMDELVKD